MKAILFDFGGTLDTNGIHWSEKFWDIYVKNKLNISKEDYEDAYRFSEGHINGTVEKCATMKTILKLQITLQIEYLAANKILNPLDKNELINIITSQCYDDVIKCISNYVPVLNGLKQNYLIGLVSNFYGNLENVLKEFKIRNIFDVIIDSEIEGIRKPDPEIFCLALRQLNIPGAEAVVIGDSYDRDIIPAKKAGCATIWLDGKSWTKPAATGKADIIIHSLDELMSALTELKTKEIKNKF